MTGTAPRIELVALDKPLDLKVILGQAHFIRRKGVVVSRRECALIAAAAAGATAVLAFRAGRLAAKAEWRAAHATSAPPGTAAPSAPGGHGPADFSEWEQAAVPRDS